MPGCANISHANICYTTQQITEHLLIPTRWEWCLNNSLLQPFAITSGTVRHVQLHKNVDNSQGLLLMHMSFCSKYSLHEVEKGTIAGPVSMLDKQTRHQTEHSSILSLWPILELLKFRFFLMPWLLLQLMVLKLILLSENNNNNNTMPILGASLMPKLNCKKISIHRAQNSTLLPLFHCTILYI